MTFDRCVLVGLLAVTGFAAGQDVELKTARQKVSYGFGLNVGRDMLRGGIVKDDLDLAVFIQGLRDAMSEGGDTRITKEEFEAAYQAAIAPKLPERAKAAAERSQKENEAFLAANSAKKGVKTTGSGLQYRVLKSGSGKTPKATDKVRTRYVGTLIDGTEFDKSEQPIDFPVNKVIKGWTEALQLMKEGDTFQLFVPSDLAYGEEGFPPSIAPHSTLIFEVELIEVLPGSPVPANPANPKSPKPKNP